MFNISKIRHNTYYLSIRISIIPTYLRVAGVDAAIGPATWSAIYQGVRLPIRTIMRQFLPLTRQTTI